MSLSIKQKLLLAVAVIILTIASLQIWLFSNQMTQQTLTSLNKGQISLSQAEARSIELWLNTKKRILEATAATISLGLEPQIQLQNAAQAGSLSLAYLANLDGKMYMSDPDEVVPDDYDEAI